jgi:hypothetical protein
VPAFAKRCVDQDVTVVAVGDGEQSACVPQRRIDAKSFVMLHKAADEVTRITIRSDRSGFHVIRVW